jgi:ATP synthase F1 complex assembly factor 2
LAISAEWNSQTDVIERSRMMLTALSNTAIDNPNKLTKLDMINYLLTFAETDTILFHNRAEPNLYQLQTEHWDPVLEWFNKRYSTELAKTDDISPPVFPANAKMQIGNYLMSHSLTTLHGIQYAVDTLKSVRKSLNVISNY